MKIFVREILENTDDVSNNYEVLTLLPLSRNTVDRIVMADINRKRIAREKVYEMWVSTDQQSSMKKLAHILFDSGQNEIAESILNKYYGMRY